MNPSKQQILSKTLPNGSKKSESTKKTPLEAKIEQQFALFSPSADENPTGMEIKGRETIIQFLKHCQEKGLLGVDSTTYALLDEKRPGGEGGIQKVQDKCTKEFFALKKRIFVLSDFKTTHLREAEALSNLSHQKIIKLVKVFFQQESDFQYSINLIMPWIPNNFVSWLLNNEKMTEMPFKEAILKNKRRFEEVQKLMIEILTAINVIHALEYLHMDVKHDNVMVIEELSKNGILVSTAVLTDLGLAKDIRALTTLVGGTRGYMAPEIMNAMAQPNPQELEHYFTQKADIYSFGILLSNIFVGEENKELREALDESISTMKEHAELKEKLFQTVKARTTDLFPHDTIHKETIEDLVNCIMTACSRDPAERPQASNLLFDHRFFKIEKNPDKKVEDFEIENTFLHALKLLFGYGHQQDFSLARKILENLSSRFNHQPSKYYLGWMIWQGLCGEMGELFKLKGEQMCQEALADAKSYFETKKKEEGYVGKFSLFALGMINNFLFLKNGDAKAYDEAKKCFDDPENSFAISRLGKLFSSAGKEAEAEKCYKTASDMGNCIGQYNYGVILWNEGKKEDAKKLIEMSAAQGYPHAQAFLNEKFPKESDKN